MTTEEKPDLPPFHICLDCKDRGTVLYIYTQSGVDMQVSTASSSIASLTSLLAAAQEAIAALTAQVHNQSSQIAALEATMSSLNTHEARLAGLEDKLYHFSRSSDEITITGANLNIVNGLRRTQTTLYRA